MKSLPGGVELGAPGRIQTPTPPRGTTTGQALDITRVGPGYHAPSFSWVWYNMDPTTPYPPYLPAGGSAAYPDVATFTQQFVIPAGINLSSLMIAGVWGGKNPRIHRIQRRGVDNK